MIPTLPKGINSADIIPIIVTYEDLPRASRDACVLWVIYFSRVVADSFYSQLGVLDIVYCISL